jgi:hypothetical protein
VRKLVVLTCLCALAAGVPQLAAAQPVPSLEPQATQKLWRTLVARAHTSRRPAAARDCRPARVLLYTSTDWLRLATKLAANPSPCAQYYISIPPLAADKTKFRFDQGWRIDALGPQFHALAEINYTGWSKWVAAGNGSWYDAGVQARANMQRDNYLVSRGDGWAMNEISSAVRRNGGNSRQNLRDLLRGLYTGDGSTPLKGLVYATGVGQTTTGIAAYKDNLQGWLQDAAFWTDMSAYTSDFSQEVFGDVRAYAQAGATAQQRRDALEQYLEHLLVLANIGPDPQVTVARAYLQQTYSPLANAAWPWDSAFGWTDVPFDLMSQYVSAQTYAMRAYDAAAGQSPERLGFAWSPKPTPAIAPSDFDRQSGAILDRLAAAIRDSGITLDPNDPGVGACGPLGQNLFCGGDLEGAALTGAWQTFSSWPFPATSIGGAPATLPAGVASGPLTVQLMGGGAPQTALADTVVTLATSSPTGGFSTSPTGPWTPTLVVTVTAGTSASAPFYYRDIRAGGWTLTATSTGRTGATVPLRVTPSSPVRLTLSPRTASLRHGTSRVFRAAAFDSFGNPVIAPVRWSLGRKTLGRLRRVSPLAVRFTALRRGSSAIFATTGRAGARARVSVR